MNLIVAYDVNTETAEGRKRLRKVALICKNYGQRVQNSVFECRVNEVQFEILRSKLLEVIKKDKDNLKIYRLFGERDNCVESYGIDRYLDFDDPLIV